MAGRHERADRGRPVIPRAFVTAWRASAPWPLDAQVEQDLVLSRALLSVFGHATLPRALAFRGGTALHKLFLDAPGRYSEDLDFVQVEPGPIGPTLHDIRSVIDPWLGVPTTKRGPASVKLLYRFEATSLPVQRMRVKIEINTREHFALLGQREEEFAVENPWYSARLPITTFALEEMLATKLRALYQRRKGRDLYDLWLALDVLEPDLDAVADCFAGYMKASGLRVTRAEFEANLSEKVQNATFRADVTLLLRDSAAYDIDAASAIVRDRLVSRLPGAPWKTRA
jgi:predicted nucleotidyltransferase component of viral defense system